MKKSILAGVLAVANAAWAAAPVLPPVPMLPPPPAAGTAPKVPAPAPLPKPLELPRSGFQLNLYKIGIGELLTLAYYDVIKKPYVLDAAFVNRNDYVSVKFASKKPEDVMPVLKYLLKGLGFQIVSKDGIDYIGARGVEKEDWKYTVYRLENRKASYVQQYATGMFSGHFLGSSAMQALPGAVAIGQDKQGQVAAAAAPATASKENILVFYGPPAEVARFRDLARELDTPQEELLITTSIYEISDLANNETGFGVVLSLLNDSLKVSLGEQSAGGNYFSLGKTSIKMIGALVAKDTRFNIVYSASQRTMNGQPVGLTAGQKDQISTGAVLDRNGNPVINTQMVQSGLTLSITPDAREKLADLDIKLSISDYSGDAQAPKITNRESTSAISTEYGETVMLGGVRLKKTTNANNRLPFTRWSLGNSETTSSVEFVVLTTVEKVKRSFEQ